MASCGENEVVIVGDDLSTVIDDSDIVNQVCNIIVKNDIHRVVTDAQRGIGTAVVWGVNEMKARGYIVRVKCIVSERQGDRYVAIDKDRYYCGLNVADQVITVRSIEERNRIIADYKYKLYLTKSKHRKHYGYKVIGIK